MSYGGIIYGGASYGASSSPVTENPTVLANGGYGTNIYGSAPYGGSSSTPVAALSVTTSGNIITGTLESDIVTGGRVLLLTLANDTWVAAGATFDAERQNIINGITSSASELNGWNNEVRDKELVTAVVRSSDTLVTITLTAAAGYNISANETVEVTVPASAFAISESVVVAIPTFEVAFVVIIPRAITDIDTDNSVVVGQTSVVITATSLDTFPATQLVTLGGQSLTITDWNSGSPIVTVPVDINLKLGSGDLTLSVTDDTGEVTLDNVTLFEEAGWGYTGFSGNVPAAGTESGYELALADLAITMAAGDQFVYKDEVGLTFDVDTFPTVDPAATVTSQYRVWDDSLTSMSAKTGYTIAQKPILTSGSFTPV